MRRKIAMVLAVICATVSVMGCGQNPSQNSSSPAVAVETKENEPAQKESGADAVGGESSDQKTADNTQVTVNVGVSIDPGDLSPWPVNNNGRLTVLANVYETLGQVFDDSSEMQYILMKDCQLQDDGFTYHITLFDNIHDTAGNPLTASDVEFSYLSAKEAGFLTPTKYIESIHVINDTELDIEFNTQNVGDFENVLTQVNVVTKAAYEASENQMITAPVGTGNYVVTDYIAGSSITLKKTGNYWQTDDSLRKNWDNADVINYYFITEASQMAISLETDTIDVAVGVAADQMERFAEGGQASDGFSVSITDDWQIYAMHYNMSSESVFADNQELRQAIAYAIDSQGLVDIVANGGGQVCKTFGTANYSDFQPEWADEDYYDYNPEKAKELLAQSGYSGENIVILVSTNYAAKVAEVVLSYLNAVGINASISQVETAVYNSTTKNDKTAWDVRIEQFGNPFGFVAAAVAGNFDKSRFGEDRYTTNFYIDDELQTLLAAAVNVTTHNDETVSALHYYMKEKMISLPFMSLQAYSVYRDSVVEELKFTVRGALLPGNCIYR